MDNIGDPTSEKRKAVGVRYLAMPVLAAEKRLGFRLGNVESVGYDTMSAHSYNVAEVVSSGDGTIAEVPEIPM